ncbi:Yqey-like protein-domain-containing protein, partial [Rhodocollybia butyracea]
SILAEINAADKAANSMIPPSSILNIIRKASARRHDAAAQFTQANRPDLAEKELLEASVVEQFLPPLLSSAEVDHAIQTVLTSLAISPDNDPRKATGRIFKAFYAQIDRSQVDPNLVKARVDIALNSLKTNQ